MDRPVRVHDVQSDVSLEAIVGAVTSAVRESLCTRGSNSQTTFERSRVESRASESVIGGSSSGSSTVPTPMSTECPSKRPKFNPPTLLRSKRRSRGSKQTGIGKMTTYMRDTILLPPEYISKNGDIKVPRSINRTKLGKAGLVGKIEIDSGMSAADVSKEICEVFAKPMGYTKEDIIEGRLFSFSYLQTTGAGSKSLCIPSVKDGFEWNGKNVASLAKSGSIIYLLAGEELPGRK